MLTYAYIYPTSCCGLQLLKVSRPTSDLTIIFILQMKGLSYGHGLINKFCEHSMVVYYSMFYKSLKEYYEIVGESRPLSAFFPKHADFFTEMHF